MLSAPLANKQSEYIPYHKMCAGYFIAVSRICSFYTTGVMSRSNGSIYHIAAQTCCFVTAHNRRAIKFATWCQLCVWTQSTRSISQYKKQRGNPRRVLNQMCSIETSCSPDRLYISCSREGEREGNLSAESRRCRRYRGGWYVDFLKIKPNMGGESHFSPE